MRLFPILTALVVAAALYLLVFERTTLLSFARGEVDATELGAAVSAGINDDQPIAEAADANAEKSDDETGVAVVAIASTASRVENAVLVRGRTEAARQVDLRAETSGTIISDPLRKGALIAEGDEVCRLDPGTRQIALAEAEARLQEAQSRLPEARARVAEATARLKEAEINDNAATRLSEGGFASDTRVASTGAGVESARAGVEAAKSGIDAAEAGIQSAQAGVAAANNEIAKLTILAPFGGLLESDGAEIGSLLQPGGLCATVIQLDPIKLVGFVPETEVDRVDRRRTGRRALASGARSRASHLPVALADPKPAPSASRCGPERRSAHPRRPDRRNRHRLGRRLAHLLPQSALTLNDDGIWACASSARRTSRRLPRHRCCATRPADLGRGLPEAATSSSSGRNTSSTGVPRQPPTVPRGDSNDRPRRLGRCRARMVIAFIVLSLLAGGLCLCQPAQGGRAGHRNPGALRSVPFPGISAEDSEKLLVKPMETELGDLDGLKDMTGTAAETMPACAGIRIRLGQDQDHGRCARRDERGRGQVSRRRRKYSINEINFSEFPDHHRQPDRRRARAHDARSRRRSAGRLEGLDAVLEAGIAGKRDEMVEVVIDPLRLEAYNVTAGELINVVRNNNHADRGGRSRDRAGRFSVKIPSLSTSRATSTTCRQDQRRPRRHAGRSGRHQPDLRGPRRHRALQRRDTVALQVVKRKGFNLIDTAAWCAPRSRAATDLARQS